MTKKQQIIYLAGLVDGEGYVGVKKNNSVVRGGYCKNPTYHEIIQIRMIDERAIAIFKKVFGGNYYKETEHSKYSKRPLYCYKATDLMAANALKILLPYLLIKKQEALFCLALRKSKQSKLAKRRGSSVGRQMNKRILNYRDGLWKKCKLLHKY